jgi:regulator of protease activity HflC (stomatin/prohibitin superfamily)
VSNQWEVDSIFNHRAQFEASIIKECNVRLAKWFIVSQLRTNIMPPESLKLSIENKTKSIQDAQAEDEKAKTAESVARRKVAVAKGDSAEMVINANAKAEKIRIEQRQLTPLYIDYLKAKKWNGKLPTTTVGGDARAFINLK